MPTTPHALQEALGRTPVAEFDVAVIATLWDGSIGYWNREAERLYGWKAEEVLGENIVNITPSVSKRSQAEAIMRALQAGNTWEGEMLLRRRDGEVFNAFVMDTPLPANDPDSCAIIGASAPHGDAGRVRERNALLHAELRRHLGAIWPLADEPIEAEALCEPAPEIETYYRCYFLNRTGNIRMVRDGLFTRDQLAMDFAGAALAEYAAYDAAEVWNRGRLVGRRLRD